MLSFFQRKESINDLSWLSTDLNSHLLPMSDSGLADLSNTVAGIKKLNELGIKTIHCTPSISGMAPADYSNLLLNGKEKLDQALKGAGLDIVITVGVKYTIDGNFKVSGDLLVLPGNYVLLEMSILKESANLEEVVFNLQISGYKVILAHPEHYAYYHTNHKRYHRLKELGVIFQLNLMSLTGHYGPEVKNAALYLLDKKYYELTGTEVQREEHLALLQKTLFGGSIFNKLKKYKFKNLELLK